MGQWRELGRQRGGRLLAVVLVGALAVSLVGFSGSTRDVRVRADLRTTSFGIPHIKARNWVSLGYGLGYAYARDNLCILAREIVTARGQEAEFFGPSTGNLRRSFLFGLLSRDENLRKLYDQQPRNIREMVQGYAAGYNRWLAETGVDNLPAACAGQPWVRPISALDLSAVGVKGNARASLDPLQSAIVGAEPPSDAALAARKSAKVGSPLQVAALPERVDFPEIDGVINLNRNFIGGSNAYGLGRDATENGRGMLLGNPHEPWRGIQRFYQAHLTIPGRLNVMGVTQIALPVIVIGFNEDVAWSHTISAAKRFTIYELSLDPADPLVYLYENADGVMERRPIVPTEPVRIKVLGESEPREHTFYRSHFGYMVALDAVSSSAPGWGEDARAFNGPESVAYSIRDVNEDNLRGIVQWLEMDQATSVPDLKDRLEQTLGLPFVNTIAADRLGNGFYADIGSVPHVTVEKLAGCPGSFVALLLTTSGLITMNGARAACEWGNDPGTPQEGIFGPENLPSLIASDYVTNSNDSYWLSNPDSPLEGFSPLLRRDLVERSPRLLRTRMGLIQVQDRLSGADGLGGNKFDLKKLQTVWYGNRNYSAELELDDVVAACESGDPPKTAWPTSQAGVTVDVTEACALLAAWDRTDNLPSVGVPIWRQFFGRLGRQVEKFTVPFDANDPINTPNTLRINGTVRNALGDAVKELRDLGLPLDAPLGELQYVTRDGGPPLPDGSNKIPMHGGSGQNGVFNVAGSRFSELGYTPITGGPTYMQSVTWDDDGQVVAEALLGFSQSDDPENPHYVDQTERYSRKDFIRLPFREQEIRRDLVSRDLLLDRIPLGDPSVVTSPEPSSKSDSKKKGKKSKKEKKGKKAKPDKKDKKSKKGQKAKKS